MLSLIIFQTLLIRFTRTSKKYVV